MIIINVQFFHEKNIYGRTYTIRKYHPLLPIIKTHEGGIPQWGYLGGGTLEAPSTGGWFIIDSFDDK